MAPTEDRPHRLVSEVLPEVTEGIRTALTNEGRNHLADQVDSLRIVALCDCGRERCASFYTAPPDDAKGSEGEFIGGYLVNLVDDTIVFIDLLALDDDMENRVRNAVLG